MREIEIKRRRLVDATMILLLPLHFSSRDGVVVDGEDGGGGCCFMHRHTFNTTMSSSQNCIQLKMKWFEGFH